MKEMVNYNDWSNKRLLAYLTLVSEEDYHRDIKIPFGTLHNLLNHLYYYEYKYAQKIISNQLDIKLEKLNKLNLIKAIEKINQDWMVWLKEQNDITSSTILEIMPLMSHNIHHRSQVAIGMQLLGYALPSLDIFVYKSEKDAIQIEA